MYEPIRAAFEALREEFRRAAHQFPPLYHDQFLVAIHQGNVMSSDVRRFVERIRRWPHPLGDWQSWHGPCGTPVVSPNHGTAPAYGYDVSYTGPAREWGGRFYGDKAGLEEFQRLAESAYLVLCETDEPPEMTETGWQGFLEFLYGLAIQSPTPLLRVDKAGWGSTGQQAIQVASGLTSEPWSAPAGESPLEPDDALFCVRSMRLNVFTASIAALDMILEPEKTLLVDPLLLPPVAFSPSDAPASAAGIDGTSTVATVSQQALPASTTVAPPTVKTPSDLPSNISGPSATLEQLPLDPSLATTPFLFKQVGKQWFLRYTTHNSVEGGGFPDLLGFSLYAVLLQRPEMPLKCSTLEMLTLTSPDAPSPQTENPYADDGLKGESSSGKLMEDDVFEDIKPKIKTLLDQREQAVSEGAAARVKEIDEQLKTLQDYISKTHWVRARKGKPPELIAKTFSTPEEQARYRVKRNLGTCIQMISDQPNTASLVRYLKSTVRRSGCVYVFQDDTKTDWVL